MPPKPSPFAEAQAEFFGEPPPARFFANTPIGAGRNAFAPAVNLAAAAAGQEDFETYQANRNKFLTDLSEGALRRAEVPYRIKALPFSSAAQIAQSRLLEQRSEADLNMLPRQIQAEEARTAYDIERNRANLEDLPESRAYERERTQYEQEKMRREDPYAQRLGRITDKPQHLFAYESFLENAPMALRDDERRKFAMNEALRLAADEQSISDIVEADTLGIKPGALDLYTEPVTDPSSGLYLGRRLKKDVPRNEVDRLRKEVETKKYQSQIEMDERKFQRQEQSDRVRIAERRSAELAKEIESAGKEEVEELRKKKATYDKIIDDALTGGSMQSSGGGVESRMR